MHEAGIAQHVLEAALAALPRPQARITRLLVTAGGLSRLEQESLSMYLAEMGRGTPAEGAVLELTVKPLHLHCPACGAVCECDLETSPTAACPACGGPCRFDPDHHDHEVRLDGMDVESAA